MVILRLIILLVHNCGFRVAYNHHLFECVTSQPIGGRTILCVDSPTINVDCYETEICVAVMPIIRNFLDMASMAIDSGSPIPYHMRPLKSNRHPRCPESGWRPQSATSIGFHTSPGQLSAYFPKPASTIMLYTTLLAAILVVTADTSIPRQTPYSPACKRSPRSTVTSGSRVRSRLVQRSWWRAFSTK